MQILIKQLNKPSLGDWEPTRQLVKRFVCFFGCFCPYQFARACLFFANMVCVICVLLIVVCLRWATSGSSPSPRWHSGSAGSPLLSSLTTTITGDLQLTQWILSISLLLQMNRRPFIFTSGWHYHSIKAIGLELFVLTTVLFFCVTRRHKLKLVRSKTLFFSILQLFSSLTDHL